MLDKLTEFFLRFAASGLLPARWFTQHNLTPSDLTVASSPINLEIVSHCWNYSNFLVYQLNSLVQFPPSQLKVKMTVFYSEEDKSTCDLLKRYQALKVNNVDWNFVAIATSQLLRRAIGRNLAAKSTQADWIWFTDCDVLFYEDSLDQLALQLQTKKALLVYPKTLLATPLLSSSDPLINMSIESMNALEIDRSQFTPRHFSRATGPIQITHGDAARLYGYCDELSVYQKPRDYWAKTYEDRAFRWLLGTQGEPLKIPNIYWIRHQEKGRYKKDSLVSKVRKAIRKFKSFLINR